MRVSLDVENLLIASWETNADAVARAAPPGATPATVAGRYLASVVSFRVRSGRAGRLPVFPFTQLNVRTYVTWKDEPAVLFLAARVTPGGYAGVVLGAPYKLARLRVRAGEVCAPGVGFSLRYRPGDEGEPGELGRHDRGIFESGGIKTIRIARGDAHWQRAELLQPARADVLLAYGFVPHGEPELLYAARASFETARPS